MSFDRRELTTEELADLRADVARTAGRWARRLADPGELGERQERLTFVSAAELLAGEMQRYAAHAARAAAEAGADYGQIAAAAGLASRQHSRKRWPGLAAVASQARVTEAAGHTPPPVWRLMFSTIDGWLLLRDDKPYGEHDGLDADEADEARTWAAEQIAGSGWSVTGWAAGTGAIPEYTARIGGFIAKESK